ncbi:MAG: trigger factor [Acidobacteria bacterium]|nr:trigger factor [Acidobacteriota bacterium]MBV9475151.1 trigger factor [Acidobacteriota bacterium]
MTVLNFEDLSPVQKSVEVEIPADLLSREANKVTSEFGRQAKVPGFRPGKVPASVVRTRFAKEIQEEVVQRVLGQSFRDVVRDKGLEPVGEPQLEHLDPFIDGAPMKFKAKFEVKPQIELGEYRGLEIDEPKIEVLENDVESMIERLRDQASSYRIESERGLDEGDFAVIEIASSGEDIEPKTDQGHFKMGEETPLPELHDALRGKKAGDTASFDKAYGEDANQEAWRGKTVHHDVTLKEIRVQEKPDVDAAFANSVGGWESVEQMRSTIEADIRRHREAEALRFKRNQLGEKLVSAHPFDVPEALVEEELGKSLNNYARYLASQGVDLQNVEMDWRKIGEEFRPEAVKRVKRGLILEAIARKENITVSDVEVDAEIRRAAREQDREFADVKHHLKHDGGYEALRASMAQDRALEVVLKEARTR